MENSERKEINPFTVIFIAVQVIFVILAVIVIKNMSTDTAVIPSIGISGLLDNIEGLPEKAKEPLERSLYSIVSKNSVGEFSIKNSGAVIRQDSISKYYFESTDINYINFIVDVPSIEQSYYLKYEWSDNENNRNISQDDSIMAMCLTDDKIIYPKFDCKDNYNNHGPATVIYSFTQNYKNPLVVGDSYVYVESDDVPAFSDNQSFRILANSCEDYGYIDEVERSFIDFVNNLGFSTSGISYKVLNYCDRAD